MKKNIFFILFILLSLTAETQLPYSESFETDFGGWQQLTTDNFDWTRNSGPTPSPGTGPSAASDGDYYIYIEATGHNDPPQTAIIQKDIDLSGSTMPILSFDYHMYGSGIGFLSVYAYDGSDWTEIWNNLDNDGDQWHNVKLCLGDYADNPNFILRFKAQTQYSDSSDIAVDNIKIVDFKVESVSHTDVTCGKYSDGTITVTVSGGYGNYKYSIDDGVNYTAWQNSTSYTFSGLAGGDYPIRVKDTSGCIVSGGVETIYEPPAPDITYTKTDVSPCVYSKNGEIEISVSGNTNPPYTYSIYGTNGTYHNSSSFTNLDTGKYYLAVKDDNGCKFAGPVVSISCPTELKIIDFTHEDVSTCYGDCNGSVRVIAGGGNTPLSYALDTGSTLQFDNNNFFGDLCAGDYRIIIQDNAGCRDTTNYATISQPPLLTVNNVNHTDVDGCYGDKNGTISISASGGTAPLEYSIDNGNTFSISNDFNNLAAGNYSIIVRDKNNCSTDGGTVTINQPPLLYIDTVTYVEVNGCYGNANGEIHIVAYGGTTPLSFSVDSGQTLQSSADFDHLDVGTYKPYVQDANGCSDAWETITLTQPSQLKIFNVNVYDVSDCYGNSSGKIQIYATGGTAPYQYSIDNGNTFQSNYEFNNLPAGTYTIVVKDDNDCTVTLDSDVVVKQPPQIVITEQKATDVLCNGMKDGSIFVNATGGTGDLNYSVDNGVSFPYPIGTTAQFGAGTYQIAVRDQNGCTVNGTTLTISEPPKLVIDSIKTTDVNTCYGDSTGTITVYVSGGVGVYFYSLDNGLTFQSSNQFTNLPADIGYQPVVKDTNNCYVIGDQQTIGQPPQLVISTIRHTDIDTCHGVPIGTITVSASGGTAPLYYSIDSGATFLSNNGQFENLYAGKYHIVVKDDNDCQTNGWDVEILQPDTLILDSIIPTDVTCNGLTNGSIIVYAHGGKPQLQYSADNGSTFFVSSLFTSLGAGTYNIVVKDNYNCRVTGSTTITEPPAVVLDSIVYTDVNTCYGDSTGTIKVYAHGGTPGLRYNYSPVATSPDIFVSNHIFDKVPAGAYYVTVTDTNNCRVTSSSFQINQPSAVQITDYDYTNIQCYGYNNGTIDITATGGTPGYEYSIDNGTTWQKKSHFDSLPPATYYLQVRDTNLCKTKFAQSLTISEPPELHIYDIYCINPSCYNYSDGKITVTPVGGTGPYTYILNDTLSQSYSTFLDLPQGSYVITVKDNNNCTVQSDTQKLVMPPNLGTFTYSIDEGCSPLTVKFQGDTSIATFKWDFGDTTAIIYDNAPVHTFVNQWQQNITYTVTAIGKYRNCADTSRATITVYSQPKASFTLDTNVHYYPDTTVSIVNNNTSYSQYWWFFDDGTDTLRIANPGEHKFPGCGQFNIELFAKNTQGCSDTTTQTLIIDGVKPKAAFSMNQYEGCSPLPVNFINMSSSAIKYKWMFDDNTTSTDTNPSHIFDDSGNYLVKLVAYGYCSASDTTSRMIYSYPHPLVDFTYSPDTVATGQNVVFENLTQGASSYVWDFGDSTLSGQISPVHSYDSPGLYTITLKATSRNGCVDSLKAFNAIFVSSDFDITFPNAFTPDGDGINDLFVPYYNLIDNCTVEIFTRRGKLIFKTDKFDTEFWDGTFHGKPQPIDTYIWRVTGKYKNGVYFEKVGSVTLLR